MGGYPKKVSSNELSHDESIAKELWEVSERLTGVSFPVISRKVVIATATKSGMGYEVLNEKGNKNLAHPGWPAIEEGGMNIITFCMHGRAS